MSSNLKDKRFANIGKDPRFRRIPTKTKKITVDNRFSGMFKDKRFKLEYSVDKRGRPVKASSNEQLKNYYDIDSESSDDENENGKVVGEDETTLPSKKSTKVKTVNGFQVTEIVPKNDDNNDDNTASDTEVPSDTPTKLADLEVDYARVAVYSDSSSEESSTEDEIDEDNNLNQNRRELDKDDEEDDLIHDWGELDKDAKRTDTSTSRLAVCNMDWDRIRAVDLMVLLNSFSPQGGSVLSVTIYPSSYGLERMKEEETSGPKELVQSSSSRNEQLVKEEDDDEVSHRERLRHYQLNRLKYYYAVVVCDSVATADKIYEECDGHEFESSAARLDLRFIPEEETFDEKPRDVCDTLPDVSQYEPRTFLTSALQQAQVQLTWDETDPDRLNAMRNFFQGKNGKKQLNMNDDTIKAFLATSSEEEEEEDKKVVRRKEMVTCSDDDATSTVESERIAKYRNLLAGITSTEETDKKSKKSEMEMEISWDVGLKDKAEDLLKKKLNDKKNETVWEKTLAERREKRKAKKKEKKEKKAEDVEAEEFEDSQDDIPSDVDMNDPYFREEFETGDFEKPTKQKKTQKTEKESTNPENAAELELLLMDENVKKHHFNYADIVKEGNKSKKVKAPPANDDKNFKIRVEDPRFSALFTSHHFNLDPSDPNFKKTEAMEAILAEKHKRRNEGTDSLEQEQPKRKILKDGDSELSRLVRSVKAKTSIQKKKQKKIN